MKPWRHAIRDSIPTGLVADAVTLGAVAASGRRDSGSAIAPINASSHVLWGDKAAQVERITARHTLPGLVINAGAGIWWALVYQKLFGAGAERRGAAATLAGGLATAALAYLVDYRLVPRRLTPGWEKRISQRSLFMSLAAMGLGIAAGALLRRRLDRR